MEYCKAEQQLCRLRQHVLVASSTSAAAVAGALEGVAGVYEDAESLARSARAEEVDDELEASVALLDACAAARDALCGLRACALDIEAAVRRGDGAGADAAAHAYARLATKACADMRKQRRGSGGGGSRRDQQAADGGHALQEARRLAVAVLERVVAALSQRVAMAPGGRPASGWSTCVARAFGKRARVAGEDSGGTTVSMTTSPSSKEWRDGEVAQRVRRELRALGDTILHESK